MRRQLTEGGSWLVEANLARTARWLQQAPRPEGAVPAPLDPGRWMSGHDTPLGRLVTAGPAVRFDGGPESFSGLGRPWGADPPEWSAATD